VASSYDTGTEDLLTCGECQKEFLLGDINQFIVHKANRCNKENVEPCGGRGGGGPGPPAQNPRLSPGASDTGLAARSSLGCCSGSDARETQNCVVETRNTSEGGETRELNDGESARHLADDARASISSPPSNCTHVPPGNSQTAGLSQTDDTPAFVSTEIIKNCVSHPCDLPPPADGSSQRLRNSPSQSSQCVVDPEAIDHSRNQREGIQGTGLVSTTLRVVFHFWVYNSYLIFNCQLQSIYEHLKYYRPVMLHDCNS